jgi:flagellin FlaB
MKSITKNDNAFTGLEAAIVLIAFVVVAAVFSYVVLGAGFFTTQKSQETVYKGVEQATSNLQMVGQVYGIATSTSQGIDIMQFNVGLAPGAPSLDLTKMLIVVTQPGNSTINQLTYSGATTFGATTFTILNASSTTELLPTLSGQEQGTIKFNVYPNLTKNSKVTIEMRPAIGASLPFTRTAPATISSNQVLY